MSATAVWGQAADGRERSGYVGDGSRRSGVGDEVWLCRRRQFGGCMEVCRMVVVESAVWREDWEGEGEDWEGTGVLVGGRARGRTGRARTFVV